MDMMVVHVPESAESERVAPKAEVKSEGRPVESRTAKKRTKERNRAKAAVAEAMPVSVIIDGKKYQAVAEALGVLCDQPAILEAPDMVVPYVVAYNRLTLLVAREKAGKSTLMAYICAQISSGGELWGMPTVPSKILWVGLEK